MIVRFTGTIRRVFAANGEGNDPVIVLRTVHPDTLSSESASGKVTEHEPSDKGVSSLRLSVAQTAAFNALAPETLLGMLRDGAIVLPDSSRGKPVALGDDLFASLSATIAEEEKEETDESDPEGDDEPQGDEDAEEDTEPPVKRGKRS